MSERPRVVADNKAVTGRIDYEAIKDLRLSAGLTWLDIGKDLDTEKSILGFEGEYTFMDAGIPVLVAAGNHDAASQITKSLRLPQGAFELDTRSPQTLVFEGDDPSIPADGRLTFDHLILATGSTPIRNRSILRVFGPFDNGLRWGPHGVDALGRIIARVGPEVRDPRGSPVPFERTATDPLPDDRFTLTVSDRITDRDSR